MKITKITLSGARNGSGEDIKSSGESDVATE